MEGEFQEFDEALGGDALGRMAHLVGRRRRMRNEVMCSPCRSPFYGKVVSREGCGDHTFLVSVSGMDKLFPTEPLSAKLYAATTMPTRFRVSDTFAEVSKVGVPEVDVIVGTDYLPGSVTFLRFYKLITGRDFVGLDEPIEERDAGLPVFRYNRGYKGTQERSDA